MELIRTATIAALAAGPGDEWDSDPALFPDFSAEPGVPRGFHYQRSGASGVEFVVKFYEAGVGPVVNQGTFSCRLVERWYDPDGNAQTHQSEEVDASVNIPIAFGYEESNVDQGRLAVTLEITTAITIPSAGDEDEVHIFARSI